MSNQTLRIIISLVLIAHGIGHWMGIMTAVGAIKTDNWHSRSWLLTDSLGDSTARIVALVLWIVAFIGFLAAGTGTLGWSVTEDSWRTLAVIAAVISLVALVLFWNAFAVLFPNKIGAIAVNIATLVAILLADWPSDEIFN